MPCNQASSLLSYAPKGDPRDFSENAVDHNSWFTAKLYRYYKEIGKLLKMQSKKHQCNRYDSPMKIKNCKKPRIGQGPPISTWEFSFPLPPHHPVLVNNLLNLHLLNTTLPNNFNYFCALEIDLHVHNTTK